MNSPLPVLGPAGDRAVSNRIKTLVKRAQRIAITGHERPDGDCIGSEVALAAILREVGYEATVYNADPTPRKYAFLDPDGLVKQATPGSTIDADLVFVLDATDLSRLGQLKKEQWGAATVIDIDHHLGNPNFGAVNWVDTRAAATGELIWRLSSCCKWKAPQAALQALYAALVTDTGQFSYSNTSGRVLRMAAELLDRGVDTEALWQRIYLNKTQAELELEKRARASLQTHAGGRICSIALSAKDFKATGTGPQNTEEFSLVPRSLEGVKLALFFYEIEDGKRTKVSFRSGRGLDARALAQKFGGGGHRQAAGATVAAPLARAKKLVIEEASRSLKSRV